VQEKKTPEIIGRNFIEQMIDKDNETNKYGKKVVTRFPPEPNGYLHIGHAKSICLNFGLAKEFGGICNLRFDDTNPEAEDTEYVESIKKDIEWLGFTWDNLYFASDYFDKMYEMAQDLIKQGKAFVCDLNSDEMKDYRGDYKKAGRPSPFRDRTVDENLALFEAMKNGQFKDGEKTLRAKIDFNSPNMNMRDPVIYRLQKSHHHNTGDKWCIYPMYDYAHPIEDAIEGITHSVCTLEFEAHRPLYDWVIENLSHHFDVLPQQIEFARLELTNTLMSKRHLKALVESGQVDGWDDPRLPTISGLRRRGVTPEAIRNFAEMIGISKANSVVDVAMFEHAIKEELNLSVMGTMAVIDPIKVVITNYPEGEIEYVEADNNAKNEALGNRQVAFTREIFIERDDFEENPPKKYKRLSPGAEVRLRHAYFIKCEEIIKDDLGRITELHCSYDPETKSGSGFNARKPQGTIHWVSASENVPCKVHLYDHLMVEGEEGKQIINPSSLVVMPNAYCESHMKTAKSGDQFQFLRNGFFCVDSKHFEKGELVMNRIVALKSSFK
jgi:glutaminyl-tRNA synthetase